MSEDNSWWNTGQRAFFITVWIKSLHNMGLGHLLNELNKPIDCTGKEILDAVCAKFINSGKERYCSGTACLSADEGFHLHLGAYVPNKMLPRTVAKMLGNAHLEPQRGTKEEIMNYILKKGDKWKEKGEDILSISDDMDGVVGKQGARSDLGQIEEYIEEGYTPSEIFALKLSYRKYDKMIRDAYFQKRAAETPLLRDMYVEWHVGGSGTGKTYFLQNLVEAYGEDEVYFMSVYENGLDLYNGQRILFMDEFRGQLRFSTLLSMLQGYKSQFHARYTNIIGLWTKVYITSPLPPDQVYKKMVSHDDRENDSFKQLARRINKIVYHFKDDGPNGGFKEYAMDMKEYTTYEDLKRKAGDNDFVSLTPAQEQYVQYMFT